MARRSKPVDEPIIDGVPPLMLPPSRPHHKREHDIDPYESPPGAVPVEIKSEALSRKPTAADKLARAEARAVAKERGERYLRYLDSMAATGGDEEASLAVVFGLAPEAVSLQKYELLEEVRRGIGNTGLGELLEANDLNLASRVRLYRRHAFSAIPAASLKALQELGELEGQRQDVGSFESFLRLAKQQGR